MRTMRYHFKIMLPFVTAKLYKCCDKTYATEDISILGSYAIDNNILREYLQLFCTNA
jgi:hypothetical protein